MNIDEKTTKEVFQDATGLYRPSPFWEELAAVGVAQLKAGGLENFKRTVAMRYFNWSILGIIRHQLLSVFGYWLKERDWSVFEATFPKPSDPRLPNVKSFNPISAPLYRVYVAMLWNYVAGMDTLGLLNRLDEPALGNPFTILYKGRQISQDLCNSVHEFYQAGGAEIDSEKPVHIMELGAGYGRLADVFLKALPRSTYCVIDIPPALNLSQEYLSALFPDEKVFRFRRFQHFDEVKEEFESSRIRFLAAHQIELLPPETFELVLNISSLHEMTFEQIQNYLTQIDRICHGRFYTKQWRVSRAKVNGFVIRERDYPLPKSWKCLYHRQHRIQRMFFEALYQI